MRKVKIVSVDFQRDFSSPLGVAYRERPCVDFIKGELAAYLRRRGLRMAEIISDYRLPRPGDAFECCVPGTPGFESEIPADVKSGPPWIKSMNSPVWTRENAGLAGQAPGLPYPDPATFLAWLHASVGRPAEVGALVLVGLTLDCCVLCTAQELSYRAYPVKFLIEGVDVFSGDQAEKFCLLKSPASNWGQAVGWAEFQGWVEGGGVA